MTDIDEEYRRVPYARNGGQRYDTLPRISKSFESPDANKRLVPYNPRYNSNPGLDHSSGEMDERVRLLETRLVVTEKSNRALLDEVVRLQNELLAVSKKSEDSLKEERQARKYMENSLRSNQGLVTDLANRLRATEDALGQERRQLSELLNQARNVEQQVLSTSQEASTIKDRYVTKLQSLEKEVEEMSRDRQKLERVSFQLVDEMRTLKSKLESQGYDFSSITSDLRNKSKKMEDEYQTNLESMRKLLERQSDGDQGTSHMRQLLDQRLVELRDMTSHLRNRLDEEVAERRSLEHAMNQRMSEFNRHLAEQNRLREESVHTMQSLQKEKEHKMETEKLTLQNKITEAVEEINGRLLEKELKLREDQMKRHAELEKVIRGEQDSRISYERDMRSEIERKWENAKRVQTDEMVSLREQQKHDRDKYHESTKRLDDAVNLLERQIEESKRDINRVLSAEIKTRTSKDKEYKARLNELEEKISAATAALQQAISGISNNMAHSQEKVDMSETRKVINEMLDEYRKEITRQLGDLDARLISLRNRFASIDDHVDTKVNAATASLHSTVREKMESISLWQASTTQNIVELRHQKQEILDEISRIRENLTLLHSEIESRVGAEITGRIQDVDDIRRELEVIKALLPRDTVPTKAEMDQCQASIRKLAESMQTVKTVLGMKIQSEQKLRIEEVKHLQDELIRLRTIIEPLLHLKLQPRLFVKPEDVNINREVAELAAPSINKWSIYSAYKWMKIITRWKSLLSKTKRKHGTATE